MFTKTQKIQRSYIPVTPEFHKKSHRNIWYSIGAAIIITAIIITIILGVWSITT